MPNNGAAIINTGMITAVGINAQQTAASVRAGMSGSAETSIYDKRFEPFVMAILPEDVLPPLKQEFDDIMGLTSRQMRMLRLATLPLQEALENVPQTEKIPLFLGVPEAFPDRPNVVTDSFVEHLSKQSEIPLNIAESKIFPQGRSAGLYAMKEAILRLALGTDKFVIVGGIDTYVDLYLLGTLDMEGRILSATVMDGFVPGEGAGFLLLASSDMAKRDNLKPLAMLSPVSTGLEEGHLYSDKPYQGDGLAGAFEDFFTQSGIKEPIEEVYSSMNGENHWAKEWGVAFMRNQSSFNPEHSMFHPAECFGDSGAASGILLAGIAAIGINNGASNSPVLVTCSSDFGQRAVVGITSI